MSDLLQEHVVDCPYCTATFVALVDTSEGDTAYVQDCTICCHPILLQVTVDTDGWAAVATAREDDC